jgi:hypothetical protein
MEVEAGQVGAKAEAQVEAENDDDTANLTTNQAQTIKDVHGPDEITALLDLDHQTSIVDQMATRARDQEISPTQGRLPDH